MQNLVWKTPTATNSTDCCLLIICAPTVNLIINFIRCYHSWSNQCCSWIFIVQQTCKTENISVPIWQSQLLLLATQRSNTRSFCGNSVQSQLCCLHHTRVSLACFYPSMVFSPKWWLVQPQELSGVYLHFNIQSDTVLSGILNVVQVY